MVDEDRPGFHLAHPFQLRRDLLKIFGTEEAIVNAIKIRFDGLPILSYLYYKSYYHQMTTLEILNTINIENARSTWPAAGLFGHESTSYFGMLDCPVS